MKKLFGALATALMLMTAQAASAATTFSFSFASVAGATNPFSATGQLFADDGTRDGDVTSYLITGAAGEVDLGAAGKRTINGVAIASDGSGGQTINAIASSDTGQQEFQVLFTFANSNDFALFTLQTMLTNASLFIDNDEISAPFEYQIDAVPEPATWAMLILGFAAIGVSLRRRRGLSARFA